MIYKKPRSICRREGEDGRRVRRGDRSGISLQPRANSVEVSAMNPVNATALYISASRLVLNYDPGDPKAFTEINRLLPYFRQSLSCCVCGETLFIVPLSVLVLKKTQGDGSRNGLTEG